MPPGLPARTSHAVAQVDRFVEIMGDEHNGGIGLLRWTFSNTSCRAALVIASSAPNGSSIRSTFGSKRQRASELRPLGHTTREPRREFRAAVLETDHPQSVCDPAPPLVAGQIVPPRPSSALRATVRQGRECIAVVLEDHDHTCRRGMNRHAVECHRAARCRQQTAKYTQKRGLADTGAPDDRDDLSGAHIERDVAQHGLCTIGVGSRTPTESTEYKIRFTGLATPREFRSGSVCVEPTDFDMAMYGASSSGVISTAQSGNGERAMTSAGDVQPGFCQRTRLVKGRR